MRTVLALVGSLWWFGLSAQVVGVEQLVPDSGTTYRVSMKDGSVVFGELQATDAISITLNTLQLGLLTIQKGSILEVHRVDHQLDPKRRKWYASAEPTTYLLLPSAHTLARGRSVLRNKYLFVQSVETGITKNLSAGGGVELLSLLGEDRSAPAVFIQAKVGGRVAPGVHMAAGATLINGPTRTFHYSDDDRARPNSGAVYGLATFGNTSSHITVGSGFTFYEHAFGYGPFISLAATYRLSPMIALITENWVETENETALWSYGIRFLGQGIAVDLAFINSTAFNGRSPIGLPYVGFAVPF